MQISFQRLLKLQSTHLRVSCQAQLSAAFDWSGDARRCRHWRASVIIPAIRFQPRHVMRVAIVGAGPAGAHLAYLLSRSGADVLLFDAREAWEKPCGGGVTSKALRGFDFLQRDTSPRQMVSSMQVIW